MQNTWEVAKTKKSLACLLEALILNLCRDTNNFDWGAFLVFLNFLGQMVDSVAYLMQIYFLICSWR
jgi:predicted amino acid dehydrogenase